MNELKTSVTLTDNELMLLDKKCSNETQIKVDKAKKRIALIEEYPDYPKPHIQFLADLISEAETNKKLVFRYKHIEYCPISKIKLGYVKYKSGPKAGEPNFNKPILIPAIEFAERFLTIKNSVTLGCSSEVWNTIKNIASKKLAPIRAEIPEAITGHPPKWEKVAKVQCTNCNWTGHEKELLERRTFIGVGTIRAVCPNCNAENAPFEPSIIVTINKEFELIPT